MRNNTIARFALAALSVSLLSGSSLCTAAQAPAPADKNPYTAMAPLERYLMDEASETALARSGAPVSISDKADVMVLRRDGYATVAKGSNGFVCIVERSWATSTVDPQFWNPKISAPNCFNAAAASTFLQIYLMKTKLVLAGKSKADVLAATSAALDRKEILPLAPGAMCYMMSKQQYLNDTNMGWRPHLMFFVAGNVAESWGANVAGSPLLAADDPEERVTIFLLPGGKWSDGMPQTMQH